MAEFMSTAGFLDAQGFPEAFTGIVLAFLSGEQAAGEQRESGSVNL